MNQSTQQKFSGLKWGFLVNVYQKKLSRNMKFPLFLFIINIIEALLKVFIFLPPYHLTENKHCIHFRIFHTVLNFLINFAQSFFRVADKVSRKIDSLSELLASAYQFLMKLYRRRFIRWLTHSKKPTRLLVTCISFSSKKGSQ